MSPQDRLDQILDLLYRYKSVDGAHHKDWLLNQIARAALEDEYQAWIQKYKEGEDGPDTYEWDEGIPP